MKDITKIEIRSLVNEGYGFSRLPDGRAVFVPFVMPGEKVAIQYIQEKANHIFAEAIEIINPHPSRITPRCPHFGLCGGCHFQHIPYHLQHQYKQEIFAETLQRLGGLDIPPLAMKPHPAEAWNYRNAIQFKLSPAGKPAYADWSSNDLFEFSVCHLPMQAIDRTWREVQIEHDGIQRIELRQNENDDLMMVLHGPYQDMPDIIAETTSSIVHMDGRDAVVLVGDDHLLMHVRNQEFRVSAGSFFQTNSLVVEQLVDLIEELVGVLKPESIMDIYCGVGLFSAFLADKVSHITAIESSPSACEDFAYNLDRFDHIALYQGGAEHILPHLEERVDCAIVDPPRGGMHRDALQSLIRLQPGALIYVSCNPASLARDLKDLNQADYILKSCTLLDMFPQTHHIESVNLLQKSG